MGYYATLKGGLLTAKSAKDMEELKAYVEKELCFDIDVVSEDNFQLEMYGYDKYREDDFGPLAKWCRDGSYLDFIGEDSDIWSLVVSFGKMMEVPGNIEWRPEAPKVKIPLGDGFSLVAESNADTDYKEIFVYLYNEKESCVHQDLAIIAENYTYSQDNEVLPIHGEYSVKVYGDAENENWTQNFNIGRYSEEYGRWPHEEV